MTLNGTPYTVINDLNGLEAVNNNLAGNYVLGADIGGATYFGPFVYWNSVSVPNSIGSAGTPFTGNFNGFGHVVQVPELTATGLFGAVGTGATVSNLGIVDPQIDPQANASVTDPGGRDVREHKPGQHHQQLCLQPRITARSSITRTSPMRAASSATIPG